MPDATHLSAAAAILAVDMYLLTLMYAAHPRQQTGLNVPAIIGNKDFERAYGVPMNSLESVPVLLPRLQAATVYFGGWIRAARVAAWATGRPPYLGECVRPTPTRPTSALRCFPRRAWPCSRSGAWQTL
jgi:hypothetical protein